MQLFQLNPRLLADTSPGGRSVWAKSMLLLLQRVAEYLSLDFKVATLCVATPDLTA